MASPKKYIQIKANTLGVEYEGRSFLVNAEDADSFTIKRGSVVVPKEFAVVCNEQRINLEGQDVFATLVRNHAAIFKVVPAPWERHGLDARIKVEDAVVEDGQLILFFGEEYNTENDGEVEELWVVAHRCVLDIRPKTYDKAFYSKQFPKAFKNAQGVVEVDFAECLTKTIWIMHDVFVNPINQERKEGFSLRAGEDFITNFAEFASIEALKASAAYAGAVAGEFN